jgi:uncharacterized protein
MKYLLDVNALIALGFADHEFHSRVTAWIRTQKRPRLLTCSITELGFVRVLAQTTAYAVLEAKDLLLQLKRNSALRLEFISDGNDIHSLPAWAKTAARTTDGHLAELAGAQGARLATLDERIPGAHLIP